METPRATTPSACSPRPPHLSTAWLSMKMKCKLAICGFREGNVTFMGDDSPRGKLFLQGSEGQACGAVQTLSRPRLLGLACAARPCPWRSLCIRWGGHRGRLPGGLPRRLRDSSWTLWTVSKGLRRKCVVQLHVRSWKGLTWKQVLNKKYNQGKCFSINYKSSSFLQCDKRQGRMNLKYRYSLYSLVTWDSTISHSKINRWQLCYNIWFWKPQKDYIFISKTGASDRKFRCRSEAKILVQAKKKGNQGKKANVWRPQKTLKSWPAREVLR